MKKIILSLLAACALGTAVNAQDVSIPVETIRRGWGWGCEFTYGVANPSTTAGVGCSATTVAKVSLVGGNWSGQFAICDTTNSFSWASITDWSKYSKIELLLYPTASCTFDDTVNYKGWNGTANVEIDIAAMETTTLAANEWSKVSIDVTGELHNKADQNVVFTSLGDVNIGLNTVQLRASIGAAEGDIYVGAITLIAKSTAIDENSASSFVSPNPATSTVLVSGVEEGAKITIATISGTEVIATQDKSIDVSGLSSGMYIVTIVSDKGIKTEKITIK